MGGVVLSTEPRYLTNLKKFKEFVKDSPKLVLTARGLLFIADISPTLDPFIDVETIRDHSKSDTLAKSLVCFQALYMVIVCITRLCQRLPISQLEINTFAHALCALLIYSFWFDKPKDIGVAHTMHDHGAAAFLYSNSQFTVRDHTYEMEELLVPHHTKLQTDYTLSGYMPAYSYEMHYGNTNKESVIGVLDRFETRQLRRKLFDQAFEQPIPLHPISPEQCTRCQQILRSSMHGSVHDMKKSILYHQVAFANAARAEAFLVSEYERQARLPQSRLPPQHQRFSKSRGTRTLSERCKSQVLLRRTLDEYGAVRFALAAESLEVCLKAQTRLHGELCRSGRFDPRHKGYMHLIEPSLLAFHYRDGVIDAMPDWPRQSSASNIDSCPRPNLRIYASIALATTCYGVIHLLAWQSFFATQTESMLWRASSLLMAASGIVLSLHGFTRRLSRSRVLERLAFSPSKARGKNYWVRHMRFFLNRVRRYVHLVSNTSIIDFLLGEGNTKDEYVLPKQKSLFERYLVFVLRLFAWLLLLLFLAARMFIIVEAYISLRSMPTTMYDTPNWPSWVPHL